MWFDDWHDGFKEEVREALMEARHVIPEAEWSPWMERWEAKHPGEELKENLNLT